MSARSDLARDPLAYLLAAVLVSAGGVAGAFVREPPTVEGIPVERYRADRAEINGRRERIEDKLDRAIERGLVR